jgi:ribosome-binding protein aMBF1 (putative translation factor)
VRSYPYRLLTAKRQSRRLTQSATVRLAKELGAPPAFKQNDLSAIERGRLVPYPEELKALARVFNVEPPERLLDVVMDFEAVAR